MGVEKNRIARPWKTTEDRAPAPLAACLETTRRLMRLKGLSAKVGEAGRSARTANAEYYYRDRSSAPKNCNGRPDRPPGMAADYRRDNRQHAHRASIGGGPLSAIGGRSRFGRACDRRQRSPALVASCQGREIRIRVVTGAPVAWRHREAPKSDCRGEIEAARSPPLGARRSRLGLFTPKGATPDPASRGQAVPPAAPRLAESPPDEPRTPARALVGDFGFIARNNR